MVPGPGQYNLAESFKATETTKAATLKAKINSNIVNQSNPGPGQYSPRDQLNENGRYHQSKFRGSGATKFSPPRANDERLTVEKMKKLVPAPGTYSLEKEGI